MVRKSSLIVIVAVFVFFSYLEKKNVTFLTIVSCYFCFCFITHYWFAGWFFFFFFLGLKFEYLFLYWRDQTDHLMITCFGVEEWVDCATLIDGLDINGITLPHTEKQQGRGIIMTLRIFSSMLFNCLILSFNLPQKKKA